MISGVQVVRQQVSPRVRSLACTLGEFKKMDVSAINAAARVVQRGLMSKTQLTQKGATIPIPKRSDFFSDLKKAATPEKSKKRGPSKKR